MPSSTAEQQTLPDLLRLPVEIRSQIYQYYFLCDVPATGNKKALLLVNQQLHNEAFPLFCRHYTWTMDKPLQFANNLLRNWDHSKLSQLKHLRLDLRSRRSGVGKSITSIVQPLQDVRKLFEAYPEIRSSLWTFEMHLTLPAYYMPTSEMRQPSGLESCRSDPDHHKAQAIAMVKTASALHLKFADGYTVHAMQSCNAETWPEFAGRQGVGITRFVVAAIRAPEWRKTGGVVAREVDASVDHYLQCLTSLGLT